MCELFYFGDWFVYGWSCCDWVFFLFLVMVCRSLEGHERWSEGKGFGLRKRECFLVLKSCFAHNLPRTIAQKFRSCLRQFNFRLQFGCRKLTVRCQTSVRVSDIASTMWRTKTKELKIFKLSFIQSMLCVATRSTSTHDQHMATHTKALELAHPFLELLLHCVLLVDNGGSNLLLFQSSRHTTSSVLNNNHIWCFTVREWTSVGSTSPITIQNMGAHPLATSTAFTQCLSIIVNIVNIVNMMTRSMSVSQDGCGQDGEEENKESDESWW